MWATARMIRSRTGKYDGNIWKQGPGYQTYLSSHGLPVWTQWVDWNRPSGWQSNSLNIKVVHSILFIQITAVASFILYSRSFNNRFKGWEGWGEEGTAGWRLGVVRLTALGLGAWLNTVLLSTLYYQVFTNPTKWLDPVFQSLPRPQVYNIQHLGTPLQTSVDSSVVSWWEGAAWSKPAGILTNQEF